MTYHGPGQRVVYLMLDLKRRRPDVRAYVATLEEWIIRTLAAFNVRGERREDRIGVWVRRPEKGDGREDKIAAIGIRVKRWVSLHGIAINVDPELSHFSGIVPCGVREQLYGMTSLVDLGLPVTHLRCRRRARAGIRATVRGECASRRSGGISLRRVQHRKSLTAPQRQIFGRPLALVDRIDPRAGRPAPAGRDHGPHCLFGPGEHSLHTAVAPVTHPALDAVRARGVLGPITIAHALDAAADDRMPDRPVAHAISPVSTARAPRKPPGDQRSSEAT